LLTIQDLQDQTRKMLDAQSNSSVVIRVVH